MTFTAPTATKLPRFGRGVGFILMELLLVVGLIGMIAGVTMISFGALWGNQKFKRPVRQMVETFQMAQNAAAQSDRRYEIAVDLDLHGYAFYEFEGYRSLEFIMTEDNPDIINRVQFDEEITLDYVLYDDGEDSRDKDADDLNVAPFRVGKSGWQAGGIIVLRDGDGWPWTVVIHRFAAPPELLEGEWDLESLGLGAKYQEQIPF